MTAALALLSVLASTELADDTPWTRKWEAHELPLTIVVIALSDEYLEDIEAGALWWNSQLEREVFLPPRVITLAEWHHYREVPGVVRVEPLFWVEDNRLAEVEHYPAHAVMRVKPGRSRLDFPLRTVTHELGHALGLRHHDHTRSVMFKLVQDGRFELRRDEYNRLRRWLPLPAR